MIIETLAVVCLHFCWPPQQLAVSSCASRALSLTVCLSTSSCGPIWSQREMASVITCLKSPLPLPSLSSCRPTDRLSMSPSIQIIHGSSQRQLTVAILLSHCPYSATSQLTLHTHGANTYHATLTKYDIQNLIGFSYSTSGWCQNSILTITTLILSVH